MPLSRRVHRRCTQNPSVRDIWHATLQHLRDKDDDFCASLHVRGFEGACCPLLCLKKLNSSRKKPIHDNREMLPRRIWRLRKKETEKHKIFCNDGRRVNVQRMMRGERLFMFFISEFMLELQKIKCGKIFLDITYIQKEIKNFLKCNAHEKI